MSHTALSPNDPVLRNSLPTQASNHFNSFNNQQNRVQDAISTGKKVGIGIGVTVAVLALLSIAAFVIMMKRKGHRRQKQLEQNQKMYEHHHVDPPGIDEAVYGGVNSWNGYDMAGRSEIGGMGIGFRNEAGQQHSAELNGVGREEIGNTNSGLGAGGEKRELCGDTERRELGETEVRGELCAEERRELGGTEVRGDLGTGAGFINRSEKVLGTRNDPAELQ